MTKRQQTLWFAGFTGVSAACIISFLTSNIHTFQQSPVFQPDALLAANVNQDKLVTLSEVRQMFEGHFARLDKDKDGLINPDEFAERHIHLFALIDVDSNQNLTPEEIRHHNLFGRDQNGNNQTQSLLYNTIYQN